MLDKEFSELHKDKREFEYEKKMFTETAKLQNQLSTEKLKMTDTVNSAQEEARRVKAESKLQNMIDKHARNVQSLMDKATTNVEKVVSNMEQPKPAEKKKIVKLIYEDGKPVGAEVEVLDEEASGDISFTYNEDGKPDGALVN